MHSCLRTTIKDGLNFWKPTSDPKLTTTQLPTLHKDTHNLNTPDSPEFEPILFTDSYWAANLSTRRSVSGTAVFLSGVPITYKCKLQQTVILSSTESELYATFEAAKNVKYVRSVISHLGFNLSAPTRTYEDNAATIVVSNNERATKRLRHVDLRYFAILNWVKNGDIILQSI